MQFLRHRFTASPLHLIRLGERFYFVTVSFSVLYSPSGVFVVLVSFISIDVLVALAAGTKLNFCPPMTAAAIRPFSGLTKTATPFWNLAAAAAPLSEAL